MDKGQNLPESYLTIKNVERIRCINEDETFNIVGPIEMLDGMSSCLAPAFLTST